MEEEYKYVIVNWKEITMEIPCKTCVTFPMCYLKIRPVIYPVRSLTFKKNIYHFCLSCSILKNFIRNYKPLSKKPSAPFNLVVDYYLQINKDNRDL